jgi:hypothetical protein
MAFLIRRPRKRERAATSIGTDIHVDAVVSPQIYDPELAVMDEGSSYVSRGRLESGFGAPPVDPYAQRLRQGQRLIKTGSIFRNMFPQMSMNFPVIQRIRRTLGL